MSSVVVCRVFGNVWEHSCTSMIFHFFQYLAILSRDSNHVNLMKRLMFCYLYSIKLHKTFCVDYFARSLPGSTLATKSTGKNAQQEIRRRGPQANNVGNLQNLALYVWFCSSIVVLCFALYALGRRKGVITLTISTALWQVSLLTAFLGHWS